MELSVAFVVVLVYYVPVFPKKILHLQGAAYGRGKGFVDSKFVTTA